MNAADLANIYVNCDVMRACLDEVPNDISPTAALITAGSSRRRFRHINVLARNRKHPNMGLRKASHPTPSLTRFEGRQVRLNGESLFDWQDRAR